MGTTLTRIAGDTQLSDHKSYDGIAKWLLYSQIIGAIFFQKIAVPTAGGTQLFLQMFIIFAVTLFGLLTGRLSIRATPFALYLIMVGGLIFTQLLGGYDYSAASLMLMLVIHLPYIFGLKSGLVRPGQELIFFRKAMIFVTIIGILEFALQFVIGGKYAFFLDTQLPASWIMDHYNNLNILTIGSHRYKSNGFFMLEPAMFCQFLAISIIIEIAYFKNTKAMMLYVAGILTTFSGTGLVMLSLVLPFYLVKNRKFVAMALILLGIVGFIAISPFIGMDIYVARIHEFSKTTTSGYARFISIFPSLRDFILPHTDTMLLGMGAGANRTIASHMAFEVHPPSWGKLWMEYGLVGIACYMPLMINIFFAPRRSGYLKAVLFIQFFFDGYILIPTVHAVIIALLAWPALQDSEAERETIKNIEKNTT